MSRPPRDRRLVVPDHDVLPVVRELPGVPAARPVVTGCPIEPSCTDSAHSGGPQMTDTIDRTTRPDAEFVARLDRFAQGVTNPPEVLRERQVSR